jgi:hypothetical protein
VDPAAVTSTVISRHVGLLRVASALIGLALLVPACASGPPAPDPSGAATPPPVAAPLVAVATVSPSATAEQAAWARSFARVQKRLSGPAGVAVFPVGATASAKPLRVGAWTSGVAWSTAKVPVTVAAQRRSHSKTTARRARRAITRSDNQAAEQLWAQLGTPTRAARRTQAVLRDAGDGSTVVQHRRVRAGFTAFGQTRWALADQARFAAGLSCLPDAAPVVQLMGEITASQRWGLGHVRGTRFKGGWGPVGKGYLVRQLGIVRLPDHTTIGVAIAVSSPDGFTRGTQDLTRISRWLDGRLDKLDGGTCPPPKQTGSGPAGR